MCDDPPFVMDILSWNSTELKDGVVDVTTGEVLGVTTTPPLCVISDNSPHPLRFCCSLEDAVGVHPISVLSGWVESYLYRLC